MLRVMIVEDAKIMRHTIKTTLTNLGYKVVTEAENGFDSIKKYKLFQPDIVTMDITMPSKNEINSGIDALVEIRKIDPKANIIMLTSHGENKLVMEAISKGAKGYILKPVTKENVQDAFDKLNLGDSKVS